MWNSKPEFINATHKVVNYKEVLSQTNKVENGEAMEESDRRSSRGQPSFRSGSPTWSSKSSLCGSDRTGFATSSSVDNSRHGEQGSMGGGSIGGGSRHGSYRQSRLNQRPASSASAMESRMVDGGSMDGSISCVSACESNIMRTDDDSASVASSVQNIQQPGTGWTLTPAQQVSSCFHSFLPKYRKRICLLLGFHHRVF